MQKPYLRSNDEVNSLVEEELKMLSQDRHEIEKAFARNSLEEYIYEMRDKLSTIYEEFIKSEDVSSVFICFVCVFVVMFFFFCWFFFFFFFFFVVVKKLILCSLLPSSICTAREVLQCSAGCGELAVPR